MSLPYTKTIVCLANSLKKGGTCVAGREVTAYGFGEWIRPTSVRQTAEVSYLECHYEDWTTPKLLDIVEVPLLERQPRGHQVENHLIDPGRRWVKRGVLPFGELGRLREYPTRLWKNSDKTSTGRYNCVSAEDAAVQNASLYLIEVGSFELEVVRGFSGDTTQNVAFNWNGTGYTLRLTDPEAIERGADLGCGRHAMQYAPGVYLCVSLTERYDKDGRCHKLVAAVFGRDLNP